MVGHKILKHCAYFQTPIDFEQRLTEALYHSAIENSICHIKLTTNDLIYGSLIDRVSSIFSSL